MKVVIIGDYPLDNPYGGLQNHIYYLAKYMSNLAETHVITFSNEDEDYKKDSLNIHLIKRSSIFPRIFTIPFDSKKVIDKISDINPDIVHIHGTHYPYSYISRKIPQNYPVLITVHGIMAKEYKFYNGLNFIGGFVSYLFERYALSKSENAIVCSDVMKKEVDELSYSNVNKICIIPNGIDLKEINELIKLKNVKHPSILFMGLLENQKGIDILIKAVKAVKSEIKNIHLYIAGAGSQEVKLRELVKKLDLEDNVEFLGYISGKEKFSFVKSVDFCVFPSRYEPFGIVILEAMACGKPIIASYIGGIPYLIKDGINGFLIPPGNVEKLANRIKILLNDRNLREKMELENFNKSRAFDWKNISNKTHAVYIEMINNRLD